MDFFEIAPGQIILRTAAVYFAVLLLLRLAGKKQLGQMGATEFVALLLLSNAVQNAMTGGDSSLAGGLVSAALLVTCSRLISWATYKSTRMRNLLEGTPTVLVSNGQIVQANLDRELLTPGELGNLLRQQAVGSITEVYLGVLDPNGNFSVSRYPPTPAAPTPAAPTQKDTS